ncbi:putative ribonuclease H-like domain-containing protein [Senna tora]|uniref:Putative ribonuclease H-like domain-containing protein n=1 Tax=Senna tora TaxID=362788 RepID=A0A835CE97_9FABA|nr:putative ribonuclease H-like domain-containing protein [Senna tora]
MYTVSSLRIPRSREAYRWQCPSRHHYKMNTDVAKISDVEWSIGVVIRSDQGHLFMTGIKTILAPDEVAVAEALGIRWGLQIAQQCHVSKLEVETDCEVVVNSFNATSATDLSLVSDIMADCRSIGAELENFSLRHIYRESNHVAHFVAKQLYHFAPCIWFDAFPISVLNLVNSDELLRERLLHLAIHIVKEHVRLAGSLPIPRHNRRREDRRHPSRRLGEIALGSVDHDQIPLPLVHLIGKIVKSQLALLVAAQGERLGRRAARLRPVRREEAVRLAELRPRLLRDYVGGGVVEYSPELNRRRRIVLRRACLADGERAEEGGALGGADQAGYHQRAAD